MEKFHGVTSVLVCDRNFALSWTSYKNAQIWNLGYIAVTTLPKNLSEPCRKIAQLLSRIGDKWSVLIIMTLLRKPSRFNQLKREIDGISQRMLTLTLRNLERDGLIKRTVIASIPPRVDYELTDLGRSLSASVQALGGWAFEHAKDIDAAQARWDTAEHHDERI